MPGIDISRVAFVVYLALRPCICVISMRTAELLMLGLSVSALATYCCALLYFLLRFVFACFLLRRPSLGGLVAVRVTLTTGAEIMHQPAC